MTAQVTDIWEMRLFYMLMHAMIKCCIISIPDMASWCVTGNMQQMDEEKKGLWKTLMERFSSKPEESPEKPTEK